MVLKFALLCSGTLLLLAACTGSVVPTPNVEATVHTAPGEASRTHLCNDHRQCSNGYSRTNKHASTRTSAHCNANAGANTDANFNRHPYANYTRSNRAGQTGGGAYHYR